MKRKVLIGFMINGHAGGIDKYIFNIIKMVYDQFDITILVNEKTKELKELLDDYNVKICEVSRLNHPVSQYKEICNILRENIYEVAYLNCSTAIAFPFLVAAKKMNVRIRILHSHSTGIDTKNVAKKQIELLVHKFGKKICARTANRFYACSDSAAQWMFDKKIFLNKKYELVPNSIEFSKYRRNMSKREEIRNAYGMNDCIVLGHISNFQPVKNIDFILRIFKKIHDEEENIKLLLVGDGPDRSYAEQYIKDNRLDEDVILTGFQKNVSDFYQIMDFFLLPSFFEGLPIVGIEAQVSGTFAIFSDKITREVKISERCEFLAIDNGVDVWVKCILEHKAKDNANEDLYEIADKYNLEKAQKTYLELFE